MKRNAILTIVGFVLFSLACSAASIAQEVLKKIPINGEESVLTQSGVHLDKTVSSDGDGSLRLEATEPTTFRLFEVQDLNVEDARLIYKARLKTENVVGQAYLEMWCVFPGLGEYFSRGLHNPLSGTINWTTAETPFFLKKGQKPGLVKLNVVINGKGVVWIDDITLIKGPPQ